MFSDKGVLEASKRYVRIIIRRPHAYWFKQRYSAAPIPGFVFMSPEGKVTRVFPFLRPGQTLDKFRNALKAQSSNQKKEERVSAPGDRTKVTFHVRGMKKTISGAT